MLDFEQVSDGSNFDLAANADLVLYGTTDSTFQAQFQIGDLDADGKSDLFYLSNSVGYGFKGSVLLDAITAEVGSIQVDNSTYHWFETSAINSSLVSSTYLADFDGDGVADLPIRETSGFKIVSGDLLPAADTGQTYDFSVSTNYTFRLTGFAVSNSADYEVVAAADIDDGGNELFISKVVFPFPDRTGTIAVYDDDTVTAGFATTGTDISFDPSDGDAAFFLEGIENSENFSSNKQSQMPDINGDGVDDLIVSSDKYTYSGSSSISSAGAIFYMDTETATSLLDTDDATVYDIDDDSIMTKIVYGSEASAQLTNTDAMEFGDLDADGAEDMVFSSNIDGLGHVILFDENWSSSGSGVFQSVLNQQSITGVSNVFDLLTINLDSDDAVELYGFSSDGISVYNNQQVTSLATTQNTSYENNSEYVFYVLADSPSDRTMTVQYSLSDSPTFNSDWTSCRQTSNLYYACSIDASLYDIGDTATVQLRLVDNFQITQLGSSTSFELTITDAPPTEYLLLVEDDAREFAAFGQSRLVLSDQTEFRPCFIPADYENASQYRLSFYLNRHLTFPVEVNEAQAEVQRNGETLTYKNQDMIVDYYLKDKDSNDEYHQICVKPREDLSETLGRAIPWQVEVFSQSGDMQRSQQYWIVVRGDNGVFLQNPSYPFNLGVLAINSSSVRIRDRAQEANPEVTVRGNSLSLFGVMPLQADGIGYLYDENGFLLEETHFSSSADSLFRFSFNSQLSKNKTYSVTLVARDQLNNNYVILDDITVQVK